MKKALFLVIAATLSTESIADALTDSVAVQAAQAACNAISPPFHSRMGASVWQAAATRLPAPDGNAAAAELIHACVAAGTSTAVAMQTATMAVETAAASAAILAGLAAVEHEKK